MARRKYEDSELGPEYREEVLAHIGRAQSSSKLHHTFITYRDLLDPKPWDPKRLEVRSHVLCCNTQTTNDGAFRIESGMHVGRVAVYDPAKVTCKACQKRDAEREAHREADEACAKCGSPSDLHCQGCKHAPKLSV